MKRTLLILMVVLQILFFPSVSYATEEIPASDSGDTAEESSEPAAPAPPSAPEEPVKESPKTEEKEEKSKEEIPKPKPYVLNEETGKWENGEYSWDPETKESAPLKPVEYSFNKKTGKWETTAWQYDKASDSFIPKLVEVSEKPPSALKLAAGKLKDGSAIISKEDEILLAAQLSNNAEVINAINSCGVSGNATVSGNTNAGNAATGDANTMANILNMLSSSWGDLGSNVRTFTTNIDGDVLGDLYINPAAVGINSTSNKELQVNASNNGLIENNVDLCARSGNATVSGNTKAGDATTGDANTVANIINMMNSSVDAGDSFVGVMNINGNFEGDILLPEYLKIDGLMRAASGNNNVTEIENAHLIYDLINNQAIENNVNNSASSGDANVSGNNTAGSATSGDSETNITLLNLTGEAIEGNNGLLVFVNVLGKWVGLIMDAPAGSSTAMLGGGVNKTKQSNVEAEVAAENNSKIINNINADASSGDANVQHNTTAGDAKSGNASSSTNILNLINSKLALNEWFGVLFINVFGSWNGSFGIDTASGNPRLPSSGVNEIAGLPVEQVKAFTFKPSGEGRIRLQDYNSNDGGLPLEMTDRSNGAVLANANGGDKTTAAAKATKEAVNASGRNKLINILGFGSILTLSFLGADQLASTKKKRMNKSK